MVEKHISVEQSVWAKLKEIAQSEERTMRAVITRLINDAYKKLKGE